MHAIVNVLPLKDGADWDDIGRKVDAFDASCKAISDKFQGISILRTAPNEAVVLVLFDTPEELERMSKEIAGPWFAENMRAYLGGPANRRVGEFVGGRLKG